MKHYKFKIEGYDYQPKLYGEIEELKEVFKDFTILSYEEIPTEDKNVDAIKERGYCVGKNEQEEIWECPSLNLRIRLLKVDGLYTNTCLTQTLNPYFFVPSSWKYTTLDSVCLKPLIYSHPYITRWKTIPKPKELKGIRQFGSAQFDYPCKCTLFKEGDNLWIKHPHYFDEWTTDPTKNIFSHEHLVCHPNLVYIKMENFFLHLDDQFLKYRCMEQQKIGLKFDRISPEWERFWESVICCSKNFRGDI